MTGDLLQMLGWLQAQAVTHVAMESTGVYWKPLVNLLESTELEAMVVNARQIKAVPEPKTDVLFRSKPLPCRQDKPLRYTDGWTANAND
jgi:transposase